MTRPTNPGDAIRASAANIRAQRGATLALSLEIAEQRRKDAEAAGEPTPEPTP